MLLLIFAATFYHMKLGLQVVIEDYVHSRGWNITLLVTNSFACVLLGTACVFAVIKSGTRRLEGMTEAYDVQDHYLRRNHRWRGWRRPPCPPLAWRTPA